MIFLKYPTDLETSQSDYVLFEHFGYRVNDELSGRNGREGSGYENAPRKGKKVILYMPNTTPGTEQIQGWEGQTFTGPKGQMIKQYLDQMGDITMAATGFKGNKFAGDQAVGDFRGAAGQVVLDMLAAQVGADANTALQLGNGQVYNPNVELLYKQPKLRKFTFDFNFIPKSREDTIAIDQIIREFKYWSAPGVEGTNFLTVPDLWLVTYHNAAKGTFKRMNPWRPAALEGVVVQDNPMSDLHSTIDDPTGDVPVHTKMMLSFCETDIITRKDHDEAAPNYVRDGAAKSGRGYLRGY